MLDRVSFTNFKSLRSVTLDLSPLTVLVGPNGCGKSSVLQGIDMLSRFGIPQPRPIGDLGPQFDPRRLASAKGSALRLSLRDVERNTLSLEIPIPPANGGSVSDLEYEVRWDGPDGQVETWTPRSTGSRHHPFTSVVHLHLDATVMARTSTTEDEEPRMASDGGGLASTLAWLAGAKPDVLHRIASDLARVVPGVRRILTHRERIVRQEMDRIAIDGQPIWRPVERARLGDRFSLEFDDSTEVPADLLSEGTVLALGLLTKLHEPERPRLLLLDDIDRGLHIGAQAKLVAVLRELMRHDPELQIVCTTHSAYLLDLFEPSEVRVLDLDATRSTHAKALTEHPEFDKWRFGTQTGELWAALGDQWVTADSEDPTP